MLSIRSAIIWAALVATTAGATVEHWVYIRLAPGEKVTTVLSRDFVTMPTTAEGDVTKFTGPQGRYAVFVSGPGGTNQVLIATIGEGQPNPPAPVPDPVDPTPNPVDPTPPPTPQPDLTGFPLDVWRQASRVGDPAGAARLAANYDRVARMNGGRTTLVEALATANSSLNLGDRWHTFGLWAGAEANRRGQTLPEIRQVYHDLAKGLEAVK